MPIEVRQIILENYQRDQLNFMPAGIDALPYLSSRTGLTSMGFLWFPGWSEGHRIQ